MNMKKVRITVMRTARYDDLIEQYENPIEHPCDMLEGRSLLLTDGGSPRASVAARGSRCRLS